MSNDPATSPAPDHATEEPKAATHDHAAAPPGAAAPDVPPEAEATVERLNEPELRDEPEPAPAPPPELAEPDFPEQAAEIPPDLPAPPAPQAATEAAPEEPEILSGIGQPEPEGGEVSPEPLAEERTPAPTTPPEFEPAATAADEHVEVRPIAAHVEPEAEAAPAAGPEAAEAEKPAKPKRAPRKKATKAAAEEAPADQPADAAASAGAAADGELGAASNKKWYAIKVQSGREESIKAAILRKAAIEGLEEFIGKIEIPVEEVVEKKQVKVKDKKTGEYTYQEKKVTKKKKKFHGYIFAELEFNDRILYLFRDTSGVGDFLNMRGKPPIPEPMPEHEVKAMLTGERAVDPNKKAAKIKLDFEKGDRVRIRDGSFANQEGEVKAISEPKDPTDSPKVKVELTFWGRPLEVELEYYQVDKV
jgi:transcriptional antiterminator NusG